MGRFNLPRTIMPERGMRIAKEKCMVTSKMFIDNNILEQLTFF